MYDLLSNIYHLSLFFEFNAMPCPPFLHSPFIFVVHLIPSNPFASFQYLIPSDDKGRGKFAANIHRPRVEVLSLHRNNFISAAVLHIMYADDVSLSLSPNQ